MGTVLSSADSIELTIDRRPSRCIAIYRNAKESDADSDASVVDERCGFGLRGFTLLSREVLYSTLAAAESTETSGSLTGLGECALWCRGRIEAEGVNVLLSMY